MFAMHRLSATKTMRPKNYSTSCDPHHGRWGKRHFAPRPMRSSKVALDHPIGSISAQWITVASRASASSMVNPGQAANIWQCMSVLCNGEGNISLYKISLDWSRNILLHLTALAALASSPFGCFLKMDENGRPQTSPNSPPWCGLGPIR